MIYFYNIDENLLVTGCNELDLLQFMMLRLFFIMVEVDIKYSYWIWLYLPFNFDSEAVTLLWIVQIFIFNAA
jgi:hypothetical protein